MDQELEAQIKQRLSELPDDVRSAIEGGEVGKHVQEIGAKHGLHLDQISVLGDEVFLIMLGFSEPDEFIEALTNRAHISAEEADKIGAEVVEKIFAPVRESMKEFMEEESALATAKELRKDLDAEAKKDAEEARIPVRTPVPPTPPAPTATSVSPAAPSTPAPSTPAPTSAAEKMLSEKTVVVAPKPERPISKIDPYREPIE